MYKLTNNTSITRLSDNASIPNDPANRDYAEYLEWVTEGNTPEPVDEPLPPTQKQLNAEARTYLLSTDWYITRKGETGVAVPTEVLLDRQAARDSVTAE
jgi:hypothetical protein